MLAPPPLFVSYPNYESFANAAKDALSHEELNRVMDLSNRGLPPVTSNRQLSLLFGYSERFTGVLSRETHKYYRRFTIPKGRGKRTIDAPKIAIKVMQLWFGFHMARALQLVDHIHGFVPGRSTVTAAQVHCPASWVWQTDVADFFGSISRQGVHDELKSLGYPGSGAWVAASLMTLNDRLPQGSPASPVLSNLCFRCVDEELKGIARDMDIRLTRYADDIAFSGINDPPDDLAKRVSHAINSAGFDVAVDKTQLVRLPRRLAVLGILVDGDTPRLSRKYRHRLRMMKHILDKHGQDAYKNEVFSGHLSYSWSVDQA